jgi:ATP-dependent RNA helicase DHX37/DHR1
LDLGPGQQDVEYKSTAGEDLLVLPSQKRATKVKKTETVTRILSRKQRKRLEKIVEKKKKKENVGIVCSYFCHQLTKFVSF